MSLIKIANDIALMGSGPRAGIAEIRLPSSEGLFVMPGKVNPVICEVVIQVGDQVIGNDAAVAIAGSQGSSAQRPGAPDRQPARLDQAARCRLATLRPEVRGGIEPNEMLQRHAENTLATATALNPHIGYDRATEIVQEAADSAATQVARELGVDESVLDEALDHHRLARPHD